MKTSNGTLTLLGLLFHLTLFCQFTLCQENSANRIVYQVFEKDSLTGKYKVKSHSRTTAPVHGAKMSPSQPRLEKELAIQKHIASQTKEMRKLYDARQLATTERRQKQITQTPKLRKIKVLGKETVFYEGPKAPVTQRALLSTESLTSNVLINGKQVDTIFAGDPFTLTISLAPNAITADVSIYLDVNKNGTRDTSDIAMVTDGLVIDNGEGDLDPVTGMYRMEFPKGSWYGGILSTLVFEVCDFQSISSARLTIKERPSTKVIVGSINPVFKNSAVELNSYALNNNWYRLVFPDTTGMLVVQYDTTANPDVNISVDSFGNTPEGYLPPMDTSLTVQDDTTVFTRSYIPAKEFIEGYVKDQNGDPVRNITVIAESDCWHCEFLSTSTSTDSAGYYRLGVRNGYWEVYLYPPLYSDEYMYNYYSNYRYVQVGYRQTVHQDFRVIRSNAIISGFVTYNSTGAGGVPIYGNSDSLSNTTYTGANGEYALKVWKPTSGNSLYTVSSSIGDYGYYIDTSYYYGVPTGATNVNFAMKKVAGGVDGTVTDAKSGKPIKNAYLYFSGPSYRSVSTNDSGYFRLSLQDGKYSLSGYADYYEYFYEENISVAGSMIRKNVALTRTGSFSGTVSDESGMPIRDAYINARDSAGNYWAGSFSDFQGSYLVGGLQTMSYKAVANAAGFVSQWFDEKSVLDSATSFSVTKGFDTPNINFVLSRGGSISGIVKEKNRTPVPNVYVTVFDTLFNAISASKSDKSGNYIATGLTTGQYYVYTYSDNYMDQWYDGAINSQTASRVTVVLHQNTPGIDFTLLTGGVIAGKVTDKLGTPIPFAEVTVYDSSYYYYLGYNLTDDSGMYAIRKLPAAKKLFVKAQKDQFSPRWYNNVSSFEQATPIILQTEERRENIDFALLTPGKISGSVTNKAGTGLSNVGVYASNVSGNWYYGSTNEVGLFIIGNLIAGKYVVYASHSDYVPQWYDHKSSWMSPDTVIVEDDKVTENINFTLDEGGKISGTVKNSSGEPIPYVGIYVSQMNGYTYYGSSDISGLYTVNAIIPGKYAVMANHYEYRDQWYNHRLTAMLADSVLVEEGKTAQSINFDLSPRVFDSVVVKIAVDDLPDSVKFNQSNVQDYFVDYWWGIRFELWTDTIGPTGDDFETELAMMHAKMPGDAEFSADPVSATQHDLVRWYNNSGYHQRTNVHVWRNPSEKNVLYFAAPKSWFEIQRIGSTTKFYANTIYYGTSGQVYDITNTGIGETTVSDAKGDVSVGIVDIVSAGWNTHITSTAKVEGVPLTFSLEQNYPNPFNPTTTIRFDLPVKSKVRLHIFNLLGQKVAELANEEVNAGYFQKVWTAGVASGLYFYRLEAVSVSDPSKRFVEVKKMILLK